MDKKLNFIGFADKSEVESTITYDPWRTVPFIYPPYKILTPMPSYMFTLGSGNLSLPTTAYNHRYISGLDIFRTDFDSLNPNEPLINIDHYIAGSVSPNKFAIYKTPPEIYHWPTDGESTLSADIAKYSESKENVSSQKIDKQKLWKAVKDFDGFWKPLDFLEKKQFLRTVLEKVVAGNNQIEVYFSE